MPAEYPVLEGPEPERQDDTEQTEEQDAAPHLGNGEATLNWMMGEAEAAGGGEQTRPIGPTKVVASANVCPP
jgi:hypothetical protein